MQAIAGFHYLLGAVVLLALAVIGTFLIVVSRRRKTRRQVFHATPEVPAIYIPWFDERFPPDLTPVKPAHRFCGQCGIPLEIGFFYCPRCGTPTRD
jgi:hypothetical protein